MEENENINRKAVWDLEKADAERARMMKESLRNVLDPELGYSVIDLGLIRNVVEEPGRVLITMILTTPFCPYSGQLIEEVRQAAWDALEKEAFVDLRFDPWDPEMMEEGIDLDWGLY